MIRSLSDKNKKKTIIKRRILLTVIVLFIVVSWFLVRPLFLVIADPFISLYSKTSSTVYTNFEKTKALFSTKENSLVYIKELEEENSRLHNKLAFYEHTECPHRESLSVVVQSERDVSLTSTSTVASTTSSQLQEIIQTDPCVESKRSHLDNEVVLRVSPLLASFSFLYDTLRINKGESDGILVNDLVYTRGMVIVGKVVSTTKNSSLVLLYSKDKTESYGMLLSGTSSFKVIGGGGGSYIALVPRDMEVKQDDTVLLAENEDYAFGNVVSISFLKEDVSKKVFIRGGFNPSSLLPLYVTISK